MKTGLLTFEKHLGKRDIGSSRIRGHWIVSNWKNAGQDIGDCEIFKFGEKYDAVIFQKAYFVEYARAFKGVKIFDICDPDWLDWSHRFKEMLEEVDAVTCSSENLVKAIKKFTNKPVYFIPDSIDFSVMPEPKVHAGPAKSAVWFGYSQNFPILDSCIGALVKRNLSLIVVADNVYVPPAAFPGLQLTNLPFSGATHLLDIQKGDLCLNPQFSKGKWQYKSDNKTSIARALGVPVVLTDKELDVLITEEGRKKVAEEGYKFVRENRDVLKAVESYKNLIGEIASKK